MQPASALDADASVLSDFPSPPRQDSYSFERVQERPRRLFFTFVLAYIYEGHEQPLLAGHDTHFFVFNGSTNPQPYNLLLLLQHFETLEFIKPAGDNDFSPQLCNVPVRVFISKNLSQRESERERMLEKARNARSFANFGIRCRVPLAYRARDGRGSWLI